MSLKDLAPTLATRVPVLLAGNPFGLSLPFAPPTGLLEGYPIGVLRVKAAANPLETFERLFKFDFAREPESGFVSIDLSETLPYLPGIEPDFPEPSAAGVVSPIHIVREVKTSLEIEMDVDREDNMEVASETIYVLGAGTGGLLAARFGQEYLTSGFAETMQFLTHQPAEKPILEDQPEFIYYLHNFEDEVLSVQIFCTELDGTTQQFAAYGIDAKMYEVYSIPIGLTHISLPLDTIKYEVAIVNGQNRRMTHVRTYHIDRTPYQSSAVLIYQNSFGVFDTLALTGESIAKSTFERKVSPLLNPAFNAPQSRTTQSQETIQTSYHTGNYPEGWKPYFSELLRSKRVALWKDGVCLYQNIVNAEAELSNTLEPTYSLEVTLSSEVPRSYL